MRQGFGVLYCIRASCIHQRETFHSANPSPIRSCSAQPQKRWSTGLPAHAVLFFSFILFLFSIITMPQGCLAYTDTYLVFFNSSSDNASTAIYTASHSSTNIKFDGAANLTDFVLAKTCAFYSPYVYLVGTTTTFSSTSSTGDTQRNIDTATSVPAKIGFAAPPTPTSWIATGSSLVKRAGKIIQQSAKH